MFIRFIRKPEHITSFLKQLSAIYEYAPVDFGGGCSYQKALTMALFIKEFKIQYSADIGVYRGRSLFPQSLAHKLYSGGTSYGIDPFSNEAAVQHDRTDLQSELEHFAKNTDFNQIYEDVKNVLTSFELDSHTLLIRKTSHEALPFFLSKKILLGLVHIDGNHDTSFVMQDVEDYLPVLHEEGIVILDDISWKSVMPAYNYLKKNITHIGDCISSQSDYAVFINSKQKDSIQQALKIFKTAKTLFSSLQFNNGSIIQIVKRLLSN